MGRSTSNGNLCISYLFVPGNRPERISKALVCGADAVVVDLEDAVALDDKEVARIACRNEISAARKLYVRINGADTEWFEKDLDICSTPGLAGVLLPKAENVDQLNYVASRLGPNVPILPLIETARGMYDAKRLAEQPSVQRLVFGSIDFQFDMGINGEGDELLYFRSQLVLVSRLAGILPPVDGVTTAIDDRELLRAETIRARKLGFGGKLCIHPRQVELVKACFLPTKEEISWARRVIEAVGTNAAAVAVDGKMVDRPVFLRARMIIAQSDAGGTGQEPK